MLYNAEIDWEKEGRVQSQELQRQIATGIPASEWQLKQIQQVLNEYPDIFSELPGKMQEVDHHIPTFLGRVVRILFLPIPLALKEALDKEVQSMFALGVIEKSTSLP